MFALSWRWSRLRRAHRAGRNRGGLSGDMNCFAAWSLRMRAAGLSAFTRRTTSAIIRRL
jgi:hypothetical protein